MKFCPGKKLEARLRLVARKTKRTVSSIVMECLITELPKLELLRLIRLELTKENAALLDSAGLSASEQNSVINQCVRSYLTAAS